MKILNKINKMTVSIAEKLNSYVQENQVVGLCASNID